MSTWVVPEIDLDKCNGCGDCMEYCPSNAVDIIGNKAAVVRPDNCGFCTECETICPVKAIHCRFEIVIEYRENDRRGAR